MGATCCGSKPPRRSWRDALKYEDIAPLVIAGGVLLIIVACVVDGLISTYGG
jgi:hypothetical protein